MVREVIPPTVRWIRNLPLSAIGVVVGGIATQPTSVGILHYRLDGTIHIIPGRPTP